MKSAKLSHEKSLSQQADAFVDIHCQISRAPEKVQGFTSDVAELWRVKEQELCEGNIYYIIPCTSK
jgi:hypothetical protein